VYFVDTTGHGCPAGVGVPQPGAALPTSPLAYDPALVQSKGLFPYNMSRASAARRSFYYITMILVIR